VKVDKYAAQDALREYRKHRATATPEDLAIMSAYRAIARGRVVVQAIESIRTAGRDEHGMPKLAITRADVRRCHCSNWNQRAIFSRKHPRYNGGSSVGSITVEGLPPVSGAPDGVATVPLVPLHLRPKAKLENYWILWEADWHHVPHDPLLLRRLKGDLWLVLAAWDLTEVERAVLAQRAH
jgi:hypothetical protein